MMNKNCITCKNSYVKDGVLLICDIDGVLNDIVENCQKYEEEEKCIKKT